MVAVSSTTRLKVGQLLVKVLSSVSDEIVGPPPGQGGYYPQQPQQSYGGQPYGQPYGGPGYQPQPPPQTVYVSVSYFPIHTSDTRLKNFADKDLISPAEEVEEELLVA